MNKYLKPQFLEWLQRNQGWHSKGSLMRMEWFDHKGTLVTADNVGRRLREMVNEGKIQVKQIKNHSWYSAEPATKREQVVVNNANGTVSVSYKEVPLFN